VEFASAPSASAALLTKQLGLTVRCARELFERFGQHLEAKGYIARVGRMVANETDMLMRAGGGRWVNCRRQMMSAVTAAFFKLLPPSLAPDGDGCCSVSKPQRRAHFKIYAPIPGP
jgi:hypothetical protein